MIVNLGSWMKNPQIAEVCESLNSIENLTKQSTPQRCLLKLKSKTVATIGLDKDELIIEFVLSEENYAMVHGTDYVSAHPLPQMAREGWLQSRPGNEEEIAQVVEWIKAAIS